MARPAQSPQQNFLQIALWMMMIFLGYQLFISPKSSGPVTVGNKVLATRADTLQALRDANEKILDVSAAHTLLPEYERQIKTDLDAKKLTAVEADRLRIEASIIVADTQLRGGLKMNDTNRVRSAYQSLQGYERKHLKDAVWNEPFSVADGSYSGHQLHEKVVQTLTERNKVDLIWGVIPGGYQLIDSLVSLTGRVPGFSYAFAGFLLALCVRAIIFPLAQKQIMFGRQMSQLAPRVAEIKDRFKDNQAEQNVKVMELYREYGINPMAGCFPATAFINQKNVRLDFQRESQSFSFTRI